MVIEAGGTPAEADAITADYSDAELDALKKAMLAVALLALASIVFTRHLPARPVTPQDTPGVRRARSAAAPPTMIVALGDRDTGYLTHREIDAALELFPPAAEAHWVATDSPEARSSRRRGRRLAPSRHAVPRRGSGVRSDPPLPRRPGRRSSAPAAGSSMPRRARAQPRRARRRRARGERSRRCRSRSSAASPAAWSARFGS